MSTATTLLHKIRSVRVIGNLTLELSWDDGTTSDVNLRSVVERGGVFTTLRDPDVFASVSVDASGRFLVWPEDVDLCADALRLSAEAENV